MTMQLRSRSKRYSQATDELCRRAQRVPFHHVRRDGRRRSTNLIRHPEMTTERLFERQSVGRAGELLSAFPSLQRLELFHDDSMYGWTLGRAIQSGRREVTS